MCLLDADFKSIHTTQHKIISAKLLTGQLIKIFPQGYLK